MPLSGAAPVCWYTRGARRIADCRAEGRIHGVAVWRNRDSDLRLFRTAQILANPPSLSQSRTLL
jgi:hypothetical protein